MQPDPRPDHQLVSAWQAGDRKAGEALLTRHTPAIHRFFRHRVGADCDDLVQSTLLGAMEAISRFRGASSFRTLLFAIAWNKLRKRWRDQPRGHVYHGPLGSETTLGTLLDEPTRAKRLHEAMLRLSERDQTLLHLHYFEGVSVAQLAEELSTQSNNVKTWMRRARMKLARDLDLGQAEAQVFERTR